MRFSAGVSSLLLVLLQPRWPSPLACCPAVWSFSDHGNLLRWRLALLRTCFVDVLPRWRLVIAVVLFHSHCGISIWSLLSGSSLTTVVFPSGVWSMLLSSSLTLAIFSAGVSLCWRLASLTSCPAGVLFRWRLAIAIVFFGGYGGIPHWRLIIAGFFCSHSGLPAGVWSIAVEFLSDHGDLLHFFGGLALRLAGSFSAILWVRGTTPAIHVISGLPGIAAFLRWRLALLYGTFNCLRGS